MALSCLVRVEDAEGWGVWRKLEGLRSEGERRIESSKGSGCIMHLLVHYGCQFVKDGGKLLWYVRHHLPLFSPWLGEISDHYGAC